MIHEKNSGYMNDVYYALGLHMHQPPGNLELLTVFPLIPGEDWAEQLRLGREIVEEMFGQKPKGFWPSEMAFTMEMNCLKKQALGFRQLT